jgi:uncharacterized protein YbjT (DUF2867 family)
MTTRTALVVGATGLVGGHVVDRLAEDASYERVVVLARRASGKSGGRVEDRVVDFDRLEEVPRVDDVYGCLGTTIKTAGSEEAFREVDHDYTVRIAELAKKAGAARFALVSSVGASTAASSFYLRTKGETERDVEAVGFASFLVARPSFLVGDRKEKRSAEKIGITVSRALSFAMIGPVKKYRPIEARRVARAMVAALAEERPGKRILEHDDLVALAR